MLGAADGSVRDGFHAVLTGDATGRESDDDVTAFDSTGLAIQDLAIVLGALDAVKAGVVKPQTVSLG